MSKTISILGIGWLGFPLALDLIAKGYQVKGSTTSLMKIRKLKQKGIQPYHIIVKENGIAGEIKEFLEESEVLIINIPPGLRGNPDINFVAKIKNLIAPINKSTVKQLLFVSSTSVFEDLEDFPIINDTTTPLASKNAGKQLIQAESLLTDTKSFQTTILRFGGLFGPNRHPATMLSGKTDLKNPKAPVNLIHQQDCIGVINAILNKDIWGETFNAAYPDHPEKETYYTKICEQMGLPIPQYDYETVSKGKIISAALLMEALEFEFKFNLYSI
ncbi:NAD(P)-binding domain-containing protein [Aquimarina brevivitae]|uniref:Nucleoside-diphosphate-sugar epimerase n=1 Tax=Aquimarina brevivitae TaxID=323412 RepID=A0A4Q7PF22_9FLAO|nr:NAD(P)-binding domain-containing protein [Aquimarina brevivitae]RZS99073.1 nucleoside-diphosphate-sugar epimerase [Aquimarina brevivitae]